MKTFLIAWLSLYAAGISAQPFHLVKDINSTKTRFYSSISTYSNFVEWNGSFYFSGQTLAYGTELWKADKVTGNISIVKDIYPGTANSGVSSITLFNNMLYFTADDEKPGMNLWKSDGTREGTMRVKNTILREGLSRVQNFIVYNGFLYFTAYGEFWKTDGTDMGTVLVKEIYPGFDWSNPAEYTIMKGILYFRASDPIHGRELWRSDGTESGTFMVRDIFPGSDPYTGINSSAPGSFTIFKDNLYFSAYTDSYGVELWRTDGTYSGTVLVRDIYKGRMASFPLNQHIILGEELFFTATGQNNDHGELWATDGTTAGTRSVNNLYPNNTISNISGLIKFNGAIYFGAKLPNGRSGLWKTDGTSQGTEQIKELIFQSSIYSGFHPINFQDHIYFSAWSVQEGEELWISDGTSQGTHLFVDIAPGAEGSNPDCRQVFNDKMYLFAVTPLYGNSIWQTDGSENGTSNFLNFPEGTNNSNPENLCSLGDIAYFTANDSVHGVELWRSDGTATGTYIVKDIRPGTDGSYPRNLIVFNNKIYFNVFGDLWRSDGSDAGTIPINTGLSMTDEKLIILKGQLYISTGNKIWKMDSASEVASPVKDNSPSGYFNAQFLTVFKGDLFFRAYNTSTGIELWKIDSAAEATEILKDIYPGTNSGGPYELTETGNYLYFVGTHPNYGVELWKTNGTASGTTVIDLNAGSNGSYPNILTAIADTLYFTAFDPSNGTALWRTDGSAGGTVIVKILNTKLAAPIGNPVIMKGALYFDVIDSAHGLELWKSDGTSEGTVLVRDTWPGPLGNSYDNAIPYIKPAVIDGKIMITRTDGVYGEEPWISDGTFEGIRMLQDVFPGSGGSSPDHYLKAGHRVFFTAFSNETGVELWSGILDPKAPATPQFDSLFSQYCSTQGLQKGRLINPPALNEDISVEVKLDTFTLHVSADSSFAFDLSTLAEGSHLLSASYSNTIATIATLFPFNVNKTVTPNVDIVSNITLITDLSVSVILSAYNVSGGGTAPLYSFARDRNFNVLLRAEETSSSYTLNPSLLALGDNWIFVKMKTNAPCYTVQVSIDSIKLERSSITAIIDPDNPGKEIRVFPNPFSSRIIISGLLPWKKYQVEIFGLHGQLLRNIMMAGKEEITLDIDAISSGIYSLRIYDITKSRLLGTFKMLKL